MKKIITVLFLGLIATGHAFAFDADEEACDQKAAYETGIDDFLHDKSLRFDYGWRCFPSDDREKAKYAYEKGYTDAKAHTLASDEMDKNLSKEEKSEQDFKCVKTEVGETVCPKEKDENCVKDDFQVVQCGKNCLLDDFHQIRCDS